MNIFDKSESIKAGLRQSFQTGSSKMARRKCYGYTIGSNGGLLIKPDEAQIVQWIFERYLSGDSLGKIAAGLEQQGVFSPSGKPKWNREAIDKLLSNEKYTGRVLLQKTISTGAAQIENSGQVTRYLYTNAHEAIISDETFRAVQHEKLTRTANTRKRFVMQASLDKLKKSMDPRNTIHLSGTLCTRIHEIQRLAMTQYLFYFNNHILFQGFNDLRNFFRPYIESIICSNCETAEKTHYLGGMKFTNEKYFVSCFDLDIMSKFISTRELNEFIAVYNVKRLNIDENEVAFLVECFNNLCNALITAQAYGFRESSLSTLSNLILLLNLVNLGEKDKEILSKSIKNSMV